MFTFIKESEIKIRKFQSIIDAVSTNDNSILEELEDMAMAEVAAYIGGRYDITLIFSRKDGARHPMIKRMVLDFMIAMLFERVSSNEIPDYLVERVAINRTMLDNIGKGMMYINLPLRDATLEKAVGIKMGSETKFNNFNIN